MALSDDEQQTLAALDRQLTNQAPSLARRYRRWTLPGGPSWTGC